MMFLLKVCWLRGLECLKGSTKGSVRCTVVIYGKIIAVRKDSNRLLKAQKTQSFPIFIVFILFLLKFRQTSRIVILKRINKGENWLSGSLL